jgi:iron complex transport system substrate-binding protein
MTFTLTSVIAHRGWRQAGRAALVAGGVAMSAQPLQGAGPEVNTTHGCVKQFDPEADYFADKAAIEDAALFGVEYHKTYKVVTVKGAVASGAAARYLLVQCGTPVPSLDAQPAGTQVVTVPATSLFVASPTHVPPLADLGRLDVVTGVARLRDLAGAGFERQVSEGKVREFAGSAVVDAELVVSSRPSLFMASGISSPSMAVIRGAGVPVVTTNDWLESTALGRAEWLKFMALFVNEERQAQQLYGAMKARYQALRSRATGQPDADRPLVMTGRSTRGTFTIAGGQSYVAALIKDAGGRYAWADNTAAGSTTVDLEAQFQRAARADVWINGGGWRNVAAMLDDEPRYAAFKAYRDRRVWVYERRLTPEGGNDYWSRSVTHPDLVLADLVKIFHPELVQDHRFEWYMKVPEQE